MRTYHEALVYSELNPTELVEFKDLFSDGITYWTGFFLNGKHEGVFEYYISTGLAKREIHNSKASCTKHTYFMSDGSISKQYFRRRAKAHGEYIEFNEDGTIESHYFKVNSYHVTELDYLIKELRDEAFYFTLALHGIDKEYTL